MAFVQQDSWVLFVDLVKAFDTVNREALMLILKKFGIPERLVTLIQHLHTNVKVKLKVGDADVVFNATIGVKQGDNMAPVLFLFYIQAAIESMDRNWPVPKPEFYFKADSQLTGRPYTARGVRFNFWTSLYADDGGFIFRSRADLKSGCRCAYVTLLAFGLRMHVAGKTEALYVPARRSNYTTADLSKLDVTDATGTFVGFVPFTDVFRYLGSHVHWTLSDEFDVQHRISAASAAFGALSSTLCSRRVNSMHPQRPNLQHTCLQHPSVWLRMLGTLPGTCAAASSIPQQMCTSYVLCHTTALPFASNLCCYT